MNIEKPNEFLKISIRRDKYEYFSKGILSSSLYSVGMDANQALEVATHVEGVMSELPKPINKKSTISSLLSQRLDISNIIGTDMIREILRQTIAPNLVPELHCSSYEAFKYLKPKINPILRQSIIGYEEQSRHVIVGVEAAIKSALYSRENTLIEGVHLAPNILQPSILNESHVIMFLLYLEDKDEHLQRIQARGTIIENRRADRYIDAFDEIRNIQTYLVEEATKANIPLIETSESKNVINKLMDLTWDRILDLEKKEKAKN